MDQSDENITYRVPQLSLARLWKYDDARNGDATECLLLTVACSWSDYSFCSKVFLIGSACLADLWRSGDG